SGSQHAVAETGHEIKQSAADKSLKRTDAGNEAQRGPVKERRCGVAWRPLHHRRIVIDTEGQSRRAIRDDIGPQKLDSSQRQQKSSRIVGESKKEGTEDAEQYDQNKSEIRRKKKP